MTKTTRVATQPPTRRATRKKGDYINNKDLYQAVLESKEHGKMTDKLAGMLQFLTKRYASKGNFAGYTYNLDMQAYAMLMLVKTWNSFNPEKSSNAFAFFTQCIKNSFIQYLNQERRQRDIRDKLLVASGKNPSYNYQLEHENNSRNFAHDEEDFDQHQKDAQEAKVDDKSENGELLTY